VLATHRKDGSVQQSPVVHGVDAAGRVMISTRRPAMKVANIRRQPGVSLCVLPDSFFGEWAQITGDAEIVERPEAMPLLEEVYRQVAGDHRDWGEFRQAMDTELRVIVRITPTAGGPTRRG
jgi:PPOX class probable F420-dependent enzyme